MRARGLSLLEVIVVVGLFGLVLTAVFVFFRMGFRGFHGAVSKTGTVGELQRITRVMRRDIELSHLYGFDLHVRTLDSGQRRDALSLVGLSNWKNEDLFEVGTGLPVWDRFITFEATDGGHLMRYESERNPVGYPLEPMNDLEGFLPTAESSSLRVSKLGEGVREFAGELEFEKRLVKVRLVLQAGTGRRMTTEVQANDVLEAQYEFHPLNTYPDL